MCIEASICENPQCGISVKGKRRRKSRYLKHQVHLGRGGNRDVTDYDLVGCAGLRDAGRDCRGGTADGPAAWVKGGSAATCKCLANTSTPGCRGQIQQIRRVVSCRQ